MPLSITEAFADLPDPRLDRNRRHRLTDILTIGLCATIRGGETWEQIAAYGRAKQAWFATFLTLPNGIPSHDTFYRVFSLLSPTEFARCFGRWMAAACEATGLLAIAIDGKSLRRAKRPTATGCLHLVSAWAGANHLTLGQVAVPDGSNEIAVIPELRRALDLKGAIVTIDAAGTQTENAAIIREKEGHYLLAVKGHREGLRAAVEAVFRAACEADFVGFDSDSHATAEHGHGRDEERYVTVIHDPQGIPESWPDVASVIHVGRERRAKGKNVGTGQFYLSSHRGGAKEFAELIRGHWQIENGLHWILDVAFREDESRTRDANAAANRGMLRRVAVALLKNAEVRGSVKTKQLMAGWDDQLLLKILQGIPGDLSA
jgi:predicted transposase YbfD/YdcC